MNSSQGDLFFFSRQFRVYSLVSQCTSKLTLSLFVDARTLLSYVKLTDNNASCSMPDDDVSIIIISRARIRTRTVDFLTLSRRERESARKRAHTVFVFVLRFYREAPSRVSACSTRGTEWAEGRATNL